MNSIAQIRKEYKQESLIESEVATNPIQQFNKWWKDAVHAEIAEVNAMTLATTGNDGIPSARIVLLKGFDDNGFVFFTNYNSHKGLQLAENPRACLVFFWKELERQVRIIGIVEKTSPEESDEYFQSRPEGSRIGAWASPQSQPIESREWLELNEKKWISKFETEPITRPPHWGGYSLKPVNIEFWQGRPNRLHDRLQYNLKEGRTWVMERLSP